ncbi:ferric reductase NAD binding domain-containing protein [Tricladium varicosporioides]|nr:ferric reductase NAD binding domain-containing protein [Hymenoscyphus varicosporioides]
MSSSTTVSTPVAKNATAAAASAAMAKKVQAARAYAQSNNIKSAKYFAAAMSGFILLFAIFHWSRFLYSRFASRGVKNSKLMKGQVTLARLTRHVLNHPAPFFKSIGHALVVIVYLLINIILTVTLDVDWSTQIGIAKRCGWLAFSNIVFITFLALKNTPLAYLIGYSYESLNPLHQAAGYTTIIYSLLHVTLESVYFKKAHHLATLIEEENIYGIVAGSAMFIILVSAITIRSMRYEIFYIIHIAMYAVLLVTVALHRPELDKKEIFAILVAAGLWGSDRVLRACRVLWYSYGNQAILTPLPYGGTRITLSRAPSRAVPGTHCFLWIPKIRLIETHPFTIANVSPSRMELVINAYDGFTSDLHEYAVKNPGVSLRASVDGPYGAIPNFAKVADKIILVAGGSGASFTFGVALDILKKLEHSTRKPTIDFIWTVREEETLSWFEKELAELQSSPHISFFLHTTRPSATSSPAQTQSPGHSTPVDLPSSPIDSEKSHDFPAASPIAGTAPNTHHATFDLDIEKKGTKQSHSRKNPWESSISLDIAPGRPDVSGLIKDVVARSNKEDRISIAACGPASLMDAVRKTATNSISVNGPSIELHCEQFGW